MFNIAVSNRTPSCPSLPGAPEQILFCRRNPALMRQIAQGYRIAIEQCQRKFSNEK